MSVAVIMPNTLIMRNRNLGAWMLLPALLLISSALSAQYDDMYYETDTDSGNKDRSNSTSSNQKSNEDY